MKKNNTFFMAAISLLVCNYSFAQHTNKTTLYVESGVNVYFAGDFVNASGGTIDNDGTVNIYEDFTNNGTADIDGTVKINGTGTQSISGVSNIQLLEVDKASGTATVTGGTTNITGVSGTNGVLRMTDGTLNANGNLVLVSDANGTSLVDDFTVSQPPGLLTGNIRMQRYVASPAQGYHHIGSAVNSPNLTELSELSLYGPNNTQITPLASCDPTEIDQTSAYGNLFEWREPGPYQNGCEQWGWYVRSSGNMEDARGYAAIINGGTTLEVAGVANTSAFTTEAYNNLSVTSGAPTPNAQGWHLVSNPFPSPMIWNNFSSFDSQAQFWVSSGYYGGTYQPLMQNSSSLVPSMQGFFIRTTSGGVNFQPTQSHRSMGDPPYYSQTQSNDLTLVIEGNGFADKTRVYFDDNGPTNGWDGQYDAFKFNSNTDQPTLYTTVDGQNISINGLPETGYPNFIPMGLMPGTSGSYEMHAEGLNTFDVNSFIFLEDLQTGHIQDLTVDPDYSFTADVNDNPDRFLLHFGLDGQTTDLQDPSSSENVNIYAHDGAVNIVADFDQPKKGTITIYNVVGQIIHQEQGNYIGRHNIQLNTTSAATYVVRAIFEDKVYSQRVVLTR